MTQLPAAGLPGAAPASAPAALERLWERTDRSAAQPGAGEPRGLGMPGELRRRYGGELLVPLRPDRPTVVANFVSTLDGVVAFGAADLAGGKLVSGHHEPDRFVMGLLRALADVVVVGAGTLRASHEQRWVGQHVSPRSATAIGAWRRMMGLAPNPTTVVVTASGSIPLDHPGLLDPAIPVVIATTRDGAAVLRPRVSPHVAIADLGSSAQVSAAALVGLTSGLGARLVLTEGGPHLLGALLLDDVVDELFLTVAPQLAGRGDRRLGLVEGLALPPANARWTELESVRRSGDHLFLRYRRGPDRSQPPSPAPREH